MQSLYVSQTSHQEFRIHTKTSIVSFVGFDLEEACVSPQIVCRIKQSLNTAERCLFLGYIAFLQHNRAIEDRVGEIIQLLGNSTQAVQDSKTL
jgi:hypothetical protein